MHDGIGHMTPPSQMENSLGWRPPRMETPGVGEPPWDGEPPQMEEPPQDGDTPHDAEPPGLENPHPLGWRTPPDGGTPWDGEPPQMEEPPGWRTPQMETPQNGEPSPPVLEIYILTAKTHFSHVSFNIYID